MTEDKATLLKCALMGHEWKTCYNTRRGGNFPQHYFRCARCDRVALSVVGQNE